MTARHTAGRQESTMAKGPARFLLVDYNLSRIEDVRRIRDYADRAYGAPVTLVRARPTGADRLICDEVIDLDPLRPDFVEAGEKLLGARRAEFAAGVVFSDNAVRGGAELLRRLGLAVDSPELAEGAFCKLAYRRAEDGVREQLAAQRVMVPGFAEISSMEDLRAFARRHPDGFVVKPTKEGNNRGVVLVRFGDDLGAAFEEVRPYLADGVICEQIIPYDREYSYDGLGHLRFVTEKLSAVGRYPVEYAQVLPARVTEAGLASVERAGRQANVLVGQCDGPFHNEIKLSDDDRYAAVVEPNRRPAGMKIWSLAHWVYGIDLYHAWVDAAFGADTPGSLPEPTCSAATVMLGVTSDQLFDPDGLRPGATPFEDALSATAAALGLGAGELAARDFTWLVTERRLLHAVPRDNADFAAQGCLTLHTDRVDVRDVVGALREAWPAALHASRLDGPPRRDPATEPKAR
ncbi:acetyl-CoA carboxylase biotin carboxylase subunit family protein [Streptomyces sp. NPDC058662]|uniref:ATP-grasp domain-containing protein n=1 Tax=Streptomyces sp. NPDC058662 TaxID=3346583 RepID=UPI00365609E7